MILTLECECVVLRANVWHTKLRKGYKPEQAARLGMNFQVRGRRHGILTLKAVGVNERFSADKRLSVEDAVFNC